ncbi:MAG: PH domain-containing protein [Anaerolineaceae bacterium]|nr:PH domain-containing protein [Anaerolineaceae bacterium]
MEAKIFKPNAKFKSKMFITATLIALVILIGCALMFSLIALDRSARGAGLLIAFLVCAGLDALWYIPGMILVVPYCNSLKYEIHEDEVIVNAGVITKSVKHVPFRTITNISIRRGVLDRMLGLGSLHIQTAGASDSSGKPEESLVGMENVQEVYELVATELRRFRSGMTPTAAEANDATLAGDQETLAAILEEVKAIRKQVGK